LAATTAANSSKDKIVLFQPKLASDNALSVQLLPNLTFDLAYGQDLSAAANPSDLRADNSLDSLFLSGSALRSPDLSLADRGMSVGTTLQLGNGLGLHLNQSFTQRPVYNGLTSVPPAFVSRFSNTRSANVTTAGIGLDFGNLGDVDVSASQSSERGSVLGLATGDLASGTETSALGISARMGFGDGWVTTLSYNVGVTKVNLSGFLAASDPVKTQSYGIAVAKHGLFGDDALGIAVSRPLNVYSGSSLLSNGKAASLFGANGQSLRTEAPEADIELGYVTTFLDGALSLQANAAYQVNAGGQTGNAVSVLSRAKINF
jgi:hypothetical protein